MIAVSFALKGFHIHCIVLFILGAVFFVYSTPVFIAILGGGGGGGGGGGLEGNLVWVRGPVF